MQREHVLWARARDYISISELREREIGQTKSLQVGLAMYCGYTAFYMIIYVGLLAKCPHYIQ